ncbi:MAG: hypothetical protein L6Q76_32710 [Polyangiaceae bacterium]|nr:hypothetical protein [Polyangiaceae bacterium]
MRKAATAAGILGAAGLFAALPIALGSLPRPIDLEINMLSPRPSQVLESTGAPDLPAKVSPRRFARRIESIHFPTERAAGIGLHTRRIVYGERWEIRRRPEPALRRRSTKSSARHFQGPSTRRASPFHSRSSARRI